MKLGVVENTFDKVVEATRVSVRCLDRRTAKIEFPGDIKVEVGFVPSRAGKDDDDRERRQRADDSTA